LKVSYPTYHTQGSIKKDETTISRGVSLPICFILLLELSLNLNSSEMTADLTVGQP